jgi:hypothetical protein
LDPAQFDLELMFLEEKSVGFWVSAPEIKKTLFFARRCNLTNLTPFYGYLMAIINFQYYQ